ncbi:MAG: cobalamin-dependent protein, partial [Caldilineaceae bacterium]|nr:cobalamin-dependent protein [Caldilineaceae bacterium]
MVQETSLKPDTLRAWERRYGLPAPQRTESGHRLYSQNDVDLLKWLMARQNDGMSISRAVELWRRLEAESRDPLQALPMTQGSTATTQSVAIGSMTASSGSYTPDDAISRLRDEWITCCLHFDEQCADRIVTQSFALFPVETVCKEVLQKGLAVIGEQWYLGDITVQQEHFASALALRRIEALLTATPPPTRPGRILIGCPPDEVHTFAPLILTLLLRRRGWNVIFLGANVPIQDFIFTVQTTRPQFVILTAQLLYTAAGVREMGELIRAINVPMGYGGLIFAQLPELHQHIAGHYLGDTFESAIEQAEKQMFAPRLPRPVAPLSPQLEEALTQFWTHQQQIDIEVYRL